MKRRLSIACLLLVALPAVADEVARLHSIFDNSWERRLRENPLFATSVGRHEYDDRLPSVTPQDLALRQAERKATREVLASIDRSKLPMAEQVNYDIFLRQIDEGIESYDLGDYQMPINADSGFHTGFSTNCRLHSLQANFAFPLCMCPFFTTQLDPQPGQLTIPLPSAFPSCPFYITTWRGLP